MSTIARRIAAGIVLAAAPTMIALGVAGNADAHTTLANNGPQVAHTAFALQDNAPQPGSAVHHHHQKNR